MWKNTKDAINVLFCANKYKERNIFENEIKSFLIVKRRRRKENSGKLFCRRYKHSEFNTWSISSP